MDAESQGWALILGVRVWLCKRWKQGSQHVILSCFLFSNLGALGGEAPSSLFTRTQEWGLTVEQPLLLVALGVLLPGSATWGTVKAGRLPASF